MGRTYRCVPTASFSVGAAMFGEPREVELKGLAGMHIVYAVAAG